MGTRQLEEYFAKAWETRWPDLPLEREVKIIPRRQFRFDFIHREAMVAIEINGGIYLRSGGHTSPSGIQRDYEKNNLAIAHGWEAYQLSKAMINPKWLWLIGDRIKQRKKTTRKIT